ncbi:V-type ATP synthase subunit E [Treponema phagedenis]|uniref:V-type ATP synthase subunit E n=1 Tax=Treponema phagedenis TaxID=162 RepID=A0A0B7GQ60_TREPH|nr:V-type ATP synthase subunit E family protein [Treponema phagedenis]NVP25550.1 V-type ATP synthase subunit E [Treponema phagedenis]QEJ94346.1 V-type ATP synthase subunit E [Treponema phagedenis]QEJ97350.1 V-type ATP synthase subunit E [Treponema phagedenis]QEK01736.1 V-type ATP synthase subunit E [Treponema phagedenis]QEK02456.1 V-type ATP synthase subunit E [Treponema phagedenis]
MEIQLQELVDKIKQAGVAPAEEQAAKLISDAEDKARSIIDDAHAEAKQIIQTAKTEAERFDQAAVASIFQAGRNTLLSFRDNLLAQLDAFIKTETLKAYDRDVLRNLIPEAVLAWIKNTGNDDLSIILSPEDADALKNVLLTGLKEKLSSGIEIKADDQVEGGFRIATKDGAAYYDFSAEAVANLFSSYINPRTAEILKTAAKEL